MPVRIRRSSPLGIMVASTKSTSPPIGEVARHLARHRGDLALDASHPRLPRVAAHDVAEGLVVEAELAGGEAVGGELLRDEVAPGDTDLFRVRVAGQRQDLHAIAERPGDGVEGV